MDFASSSVKHYSHTPVGCVSIFHSYDHTGSPNITSLTFNGSSNTLTCTSTGGPATTITWRKDGVVITLNGTYQQTKTVVDPVEGTYQTVLTIDPSVGQSDIVGTYNCTVENDRGASSRTVVVPGETTTCMYTDIITVLLIVLTVFHDYVLEIRIVTNKQSAFN